MMITPSIVSFHQHKKVCSGKSGCQLSGAPSFTLVELLGVITIIGILAGLTLGGAGAVRRHGAVNQAKAEISALQAACERFYADNQSYPTGQLGEHSTNPPSSYFDPAAATSGNYYIKASTCLFASLFGATSLSNQPTSKRYFEPKPGMVYANNSANYFVDPWGYPYGYYTDGTNPPLIWSTAGQIGNSVRVGTNKWITSWPKM